MALRTALARPGEAEGVVSDKDLLGLLIGIGLLIAFVAYNAYIYFHPDRFGWLVLSPTDPKLPSTPAKSDQSRHDPA